MSKIERDKTFFELLAEPLLVPDYQRDYAQGRSNDLKILDTRRNFVADIILAAINEKQTHLGLVFGSDNNGLNGFVAVDGQQRLTTCFLFHLYISKNLSNDANSDLSERLRNFGWFGRIYAAEFTEFLLESTWTITASTKLSETFKQSKDYFSIWENDPTVNNMLVMLDEIHCQMSKIKDCSITDIKNNLISENCKLNFDYMKLEPGTDEFQYQKMNSRGRDLTTYELFKQKFMSECPVSEELKEKMDNEWLIFFDKLAIKQKSDVDIFLQNYINETALWMGLKFSGDSYQFMSQIEKSKLKENRTDVGFVGFGAYKEFSEHLSEWERLMDWLVANYTLVTQCINEFWYTSESTRYEDIFKTADYQARAVNYAICHYANKIGYELLNSDNFKLWWRPVHNLIANTEITKDNILNIIRAIDKLPSEGLFSFLKNETLSGFSEYQREEERRKAIICLEKPEMIELFIEQEKRKRFYGQIGLLIPDNNIMNPEYWKTIVSTYESLVGDRYIHRESSDFDFITAMLTFVGDEYSQYTVNGLKLKYENKHLMGQRIPARWIHKMIFQFINNLNTGVAPTATDFFKKCTESWLQDYEKSSYNEKRDKAWIKYILINKEECRKVFTDSDYGKLTSKDGNLWLYLKSNKNERDILLSNKRKAVIESLTGLEDWWVYKHDVVKRYSDYPYLKVVFTSDRIWVGIDYNNDFIMPDKLPDQVYSDPRHKAWSWFPDGLLHNYIEHENETFESYVSMLSKELQLFCEKFVTSLKLNKEDVEISIENK